MKPASTAWISVVAVAGVLFSVYLAVTRPLGMEEAQLWNDLIRPHWRESVFAPDAWSGILYAVTAERAVGLLRLSEFSLRFPSVLSGLACAWVLWRTKNPLLAGAYVVAAAAGWFSIAAGHGCATAFCFLAVTYPRYAGGLFGVGIAFSPVFALAAVACWRIRHIERVVIPAFVTAFLILLIPASHAGTPKSDDARPDFYREINRRNAARGGGFRPPVGVAK
jgi:hypothetical protein